MTVARKSSRRRQRQWTQAEALAAPRVDLAGIAAISGWSKAAVTSWRNEYLTELNAAKKEGREPEFDHRHLLAPAEELAGGGSWVPDDVVAWLRLYGRMSKTSYERRARPSGGRPVGTGIRQHEALQAALDRAQALEPAGVDPVARLRKVSSDPFSSEDVRRAAQRQLSQLAKAA